MKKREGERAEAGGTAEGEGGTDSPLSKEWETGLHLKTPEPKANACWTEPVRGPFKICFDENTLSSSSTVGRM